MSSEDRASLLDVIVIAAAVLLAGFLAYHGWRRYKAPPAGAAVSAVPAGSETPEFPANLPPLPVTESRQAVSGVPPVAAPAPKRR